MNCPKHKNEILDWDKILKGYYCPYCDEVYILISDKLLKKIKKDCLNLKKQNQLTGYGQGQLDLIGILDFV